MVAFHLTYCLKANRSKMPSYTSLAFSSTALNHLWFYHRRMCVYDWPGSSLLFCVLVHNMWWHLCIYFIAMCVRLWFNIL